jgi:hypothetical protein
VYSYKYINVDKFSNYSRDDEEYLGSTLDSNDSYRLESDPKERNKTNNYGYW